MSIPIDPLLGVTFLIATEPVQSAGQFFLLSKSQVSFGFGTRKPALAAVTTIINPIKLPTRAGNSGPSR